VHVAVGHGVCLTVDDAILGRYRVDLFDGSFRRVRSLPLPGYPSRARVSPDGRYVAFTVFVSGHAVALRENAESPSVSPDGTRVVFKRQLATFANLRWQLTVLDLRTQQETALAAESSSVDDQAEWLDAERIVYGIPDRSGRAADSPDLWS
jgi:dipeptidyl aminopeptidase/acylaminoacyl peptidase